MGEREVVRTHLLGCIPCLRQVQELGSSGIQATSKKAQRTTIPAEVYHKVVDSVFSSVLKENCEIEAQRASAFELVEELSKLAPNQQVLLVQNHPRFQTWGLVEELLAQCMKSWTEDPWQAEQLACLGVEVATHLEIDGFRQRLLNDLKAEAWAYIGNCRRIRSDLRGAEQAFRVAEGLLERGMGDPLDRARMLDLKSSLMRAFRDFASAEKLLAAAIHWYRTSGDHHLEGRALLKRAKLLGDAGRIAETIPVLEEASELLDSAREPILLFMLKKDLLHNLSELGRAEEAQQLLPEVRELARLHGSRLERLRFLWIEGIARRNLGQLELAAEALKQVREGFMAVGIGYDVALVSLDLATIYIRSGRTEEARLLATESIPLFTSRGIHREALMAWNLFREAAERDALTLGLVQEVASRIRQSQSRPTAGGDLP